MIVVHSVAYELFYEINRMILEWCVAGCLCGQQGLDSSLILLNLCPLC